MEREEPFSSLPVCVCVCVCECVCGVWECECEIAASIGKLNNNKTWKGKAEGPGETD